MDTRVKISQLLEYKDFYDDEKSFEDVEFLLKGIPSETLINYLSGYNVNLYLHDNDEFTGRIQFALVNSLLEKCSESIKCKWCEVVKRIGECNSPIMFYSYTNLLIYDFVFQHFNNEICRDLTNEEAENFFKAYLLFNGSVNSKYVFNQTEFDKDSNSGNVEKSTIPYFIYQQDYKSSLDFGNQLFRGYSFFQYLEEDVRFAGYIKKYYSYKCVGSCNELFKNLLVIFSKLNIEKCQRMQLIDLQQEHCMGCINISFINSLCINQSLQNYLSDTNFSTLRNHFLYKISEFQYFVLDVNFLIDYFYKAQVFAFNQYLKDQKVCNDFLSIKAKQFTEEQYLPQILDACFPDYIKYYNSCCQDSKGEELCDAYVRRDNKILIMELKDVLLNGEIKNSGDNSKIFDEFDKKFVKNEKGKQKGITQLINAAVDVNKNCVKFDDTFPTDNIEIYPLVIYTDNSFGIDGLNKYYASLFSEKINKESLNTTVNNVCFINLSYFEAHRDLLSSKKIDIFTLLDKYYEYVSSNQFMLTPFEAFSRAFLNETDLGNNVESESFSELLSKIMQDE